jgi:hypothetical protein
VQVKVTATEVVFQPAALGAGEAAAVMVGGVVSRLTVTLALAEFPLVSIAVPETI